MADNPLIRYLVNKHGTGIASRATASGNHSLAEATINDYAAAGQVVPPEIASKLQELNSITQQESVLAQAGAGGRAALAGTGYDPVQNRNRAAQLEQEIIAGSAIARNAGAAAELKMQQEKARAMELENNYAAAVFGGKVANDLAAFQLSAEQNRDAVTALEEGRFAKQVEEHAYATGKSLDDLYSIYSSNDPKLMQETFGTTDRRIVHQILRQQQLVKNEETNARIAGMRDAVALQAYELQNSADLTTDQLLQMQSGALEMPAGVTKMALDAAIADRTAAVQGANALQAAETQGILAGQEYDKLVANSLTAPETAQVLALALQGKMATPDGRTLDAGKVLELAHSGNMAGLAELVMKATNNGTVPLQVLTRTGSVAQVSAAVLLESLGQKALDAKVRAEQQVVSQANFTRYAAELQENKRIVSGMEGMLGVKIPAQLSMQIETGFQAARIHYEQAAHATTPEQRTLHEAEAMRIMGETRETLMRAAEQQGVPPVMLEDIRQGRFASEESYGQAVVSLLDPGAYRSPMTKALNDLIRARGVTRDELAEFAKNPTATGSLELGHNWLGQPKITMTDIKRTVDSVGFEYLAGAALRDLDENPAYDRLPGPARVALNQSVARVSEKLAAGDVAPSEAFGQMVGALRVVDDLTYTAEMQAFREGKIEAPQYQRGQIFKTFQAGLENSGALEAALAPNGQLSRDTAALLTLYNGASTVGVHTSGPNAMATEDLLPNAVMHLGNSLKTELVGAQYTKISWPLRIVTGDAVSILSELPEYADAGVPADDWYSPAATPEYQRDKADLEMAIKLAYVEKLVDPNKDRSSLGGVVPLPSFGAGPFGGTGVPSRTWFGNTIATKEDAIKQLRLLGNTKLADRLEATE